MTTKAKAAVEASAFLEQLLGGPLTFGKNLRAIREGDGLTQAAFAEKLGVSKQNLSDIENERRNVSVERAAEWAKKLGYSTAQASNLAGVVVIGSIAGFEVYPGGAGYTASKHALRALTRTLRLELLGRPVRVTDVSPGLAETEFALVRFAGDRERARKVYEGMTPLVAEDIARAIAWVASRPPHVDIDELVIRPRDQASATLVHRRAPGGGRP